MKPNNNGILYFIVLFIKRKIIDITIAKVNKISKLINPSRINRVLKLKSIVFLIFSQVEG
jgi:hypothetical protein